MEKIFLKNNTYYIPIGNNCAPTWYLQKIGYRNFAFPFDWTVTPINSAIEILNNDFEDFFNLDNLIFLPSTKRLLFKNDEDNPELVDDIITPVYDKKYHILFVHDFSENAKLEYIKVKEKYMRRVERFKKLLKNKNKKIIFIYDNTQPNEWQKNQYDKVNFDFKILSEKELNNLHLKQYDVDFISLKEFKKEII
jgi:hypothetical protein